MAIYTRKMASYVLALVKNSALLSELNVESITCLAEYCVCNLHSHNELFDKANEERKNG